MTQAMSTGRMTSIPLHADVLQQLQSRKTGGKTWGEFLLDLLEEFDPPEWLAELETRRRTGRWLPVGQLDRFHDRLRRQGK